MIGLVRSNEGLPGLCLTPSEESHGIGTTVPRNGEDIKESATILEFQNLESARVFQDMVNILVFDIAHQNDPDPHAG